MTLRLYNTLTRAKEDFAPLVEGKVGLYVCGPTVYGPCHIGHARCYVSFDVLYRYLRYKGYAVTHVRNYTDVDDKIINRANEEGRTAREVAAEFEAMFDEDMDALGLMHPDVGPKVTEHIAEILHLIGKLVENGTAYESEGDVFFSVKKDPDYGKLAHRRPDDLAAGMRVDINEAKADPLDFALWKAAKPGEPSWDSPWGNGRPGWHIECSAMSQKYLGTTFDIHGGGNDLIFPHHENEIAQSEMASGEPFARYWVHNGHVNINKEKMSKSLGNIINIRDILTDYPAEALKFFLLSAHYRSPLDYNKNDLDLHTQKYIGFYKTLARLGEALGDTDDAPEEKPEGELSGCAQELREFMERFSQQFEAAMDEDLNTALALGHFHTAFRLLNRCLDAEKFSDKELVVLRWARHNIVALGHVLGLLEQPPAAFLAAEQERKAAALEISPEDIEALIAERVAARKAKDFARADEIRARLKAQGVILEDGAGGASTWRIGEG